MRVPQKKGDKGSLKWIQEAVNQHPNFLERKIREACGLKPEGSIEWVSPLEDDEYAEYRDQQFLDRLRVELSCRKLKEFWPPRGPQWDALGRTDRDEVFLVEAKANVRELVSERCKAEGARRELIQKSLREVQEFLKVDPYIDWMGKLYQYTNRIAHLYLLRELNKVNARLLFIYFVGATEVNGPRTMEEWQAAIKVAKGVLGLDKRHSLSRYICEVFIDVSELQADA